MPSRNRSSAADRLSLAAAPVFLVMAVVTVVTGGDAAGVHGPLPVSGMPLMYALMSIFHSAPWIRTDSA